MTALLEKRCFRCGVIKSARCFHKNSRAKDRLRSACKECYSLYIRANPITFQTCTMFKAARKRALEKKIAFEIDKEYIRSIVPTHCPILGMSLEWSAQRGNGPKALPNSPSLDRIDPSKGYVKGNVWIISHRANSIKQDASHEELKLVTEAVGLAIVNSLDW